MFSTKIYSKWRTIFKPSLPVYQEKEYYYNEIPSPIQLNLTPFKLRGYYQSYKYFHECKDILFNIMNIYNLQSQNYDLYYHPYFNTTKHVVAIHFRIGDYITLPHLYRILPLQYYINAIRLIVTDLKTPNSNIRLLCVYDPNDHNRIETDYLVPLRLKFPG